MDLSMKYAVLLLQYLVVLIKMIHAHHIEVDAISQDWSCPPWTYPINQSGEYQCKCGDSLNGVVRCDYPSTLERKVLSCHCMTYSEVYHTTVVGNCIFNCIFLKYDNYSVSVTQVSDLNRFVYNYFEALHRTGQMCGSCQPGYAPPAYSYLMGCVECRDYKYNWLKYIGIAILPLTLLYIVIVLFRVSITTGAMNSYVLVSQILSAPVQLRLLTLGDLHPLSSTIQGVGSALYMVWNLDIFSFLYKPFCLHPKASNLHILALEYTIAVYPLLLIVITYVAADLHERFIVVVCLWRPFNRVFVWFHREWNIHSSLIDAFATFIVLSYVKILNASFDLLTPVALYDVHGNRIPQLYLYYDGIVEYFGKDHAPFAALALFMFVVFNLFPLVLLCLYPCRCFQKCLTYFGLHSHVLNTFMDTFQGCFRTQPYDCRYFAGVYLGFRIISLVLFSLTTSVMYYPLAGIAALIMTVAVAIVRPYKSQKYVALDVMFFAMLTVINFTLPASAFVRHLDPGQMAYEWSIYASPVAFIVPLYGIGLLVSRLVPKRIAHNIKTYIVRHCKCNNYGDTEEPLPYRLQHSDEYTRLIEGRVQQ